jgi:hypothetical protein
MPQNQTSPSYACLVPAVKPTPYVKGDRFLMNLDKEIIRLGVV